MKYRIGDIMTPKRAVLLIAIVWILALIIAVLPILVVDYLCYGISYISFRIVPIIKPLKVCCSVFYVYLIINYKMTLKLIHLRLLLFLYTSNQQIFSTIFSQTLNHHYLRGKLFAIFISLTLNNWYIFCIKVLNIL